MHCKSLWIKVSVKCISVCVCVCVCVCGACVWSTLFVLIGLAVLSKLLGFLK